MRWAKVANISTLFCQFYQTNFKISINFNILYLLFSVCNLMLSCLVVVFDSYDSWVTDVNIDYDFDTGHNPASWEVRYHCDCWFLQTVDLLAC